MVDGNLSPTYPGCGVAQRAVPGRVVSRAFVLMTGLAFGDTLMVEGYLSPGYAGGSVAQRALPGKMIGRALVLVAGLAVGGGLVVDTAARPTTFHSVAIPAVTSGVICRAPALVAGCAGSGSAGGEDPIRVAGGTAYCSVGAFEREARRMGECAIASRIGWRKGVFCQWNAGYGKQSISAHGTRFQFSQEDDQFIIKGVVNHRILEGEEEQLAVSVLNRCYLIEEILTHAEQNGGIGIAHLEQSAVKGAVKRLNGCQFRIPADDTLQVNAAALQYGKGVIQTRLSSANQ
jgi:hypothetical protein